MTDFGGSDLFVTDQRGYSIILSGMIKELNTYIEKSSGKSAIFLNHKVTDATYSHGSVQAVAIDLIQK